jgi:hypothetical protein
MAPYARTYLKRLTCLAALLAFASAAEAQSIFIRSPADDHYVVSPGSPLPLVLPLDLLSPQDTTGFSFGVSHDPESLTLQSVSVSEDLSAVLGPEPDLSFFVINTELESAAGFTVAAILGPEEENEPIVLPEGAVHHLVDAEYTATATASATTTVSVTGDLGSPPVELVIDAAGRPLTFSGASTEILMSQPFQRGDANLSGGMEITDAVVILRYLFQGAELGPCPVAMNADGSSQTNEDDIAVESVEEITLTDAVYVLNYLFRNGSEPYAPFPECGHSPLAVSPEALCLENEGCP